MSRRKKRIIFWCSMYGLAFLMSVYIDDADTYIVATGLTFFVVSSFLAKDETEQARNETD